MQNPSPESEFLWNVVSEYFDGAGTLKARQIATSLYDKRLALSGPVEALIVEFGETGSEQTMLKMGVSIANGHPFGLARQAKLIAHLVKSGVMDDSEALSLLSSRGQGEYPSLEPKFKNLMDVVWLVNEDQKDGVMNVKDDSEFREALFALLR